MTNYCDVTIAKPTHLHFDTNVLPVHCCIELILVYYDKTIITILYRSIYGFIDRMTFGPRSIYYLEVYKTMY